MREWADHPDVQRWLDSVQDDLVPMLRDSALTVSIVPSGETDAKFAVELGMSIMLGKPIVVAVFPGAHVPDKLAVVADEIVEVADGSLAGLKPAIDRVMARLDADGQG